MFGSRNRQAAARYEAGRRDGRAGDYYDTAARDDEDYRRGYWAGMRESIDAEKADRA